MDKPIKKRGDKMARPQKQGLDYFALDVNMNDEVELIEAEHGIEGFAILIKMFQKIYSEGYFYEWDEKHQLLFSNRVSVDRNKVINVINDCIKWGIFNSHMYDKYRILTSRRIQEHYIAAIYKRVNVEILKEYLLVDISNKSNINIASVSDNGNEDRNIITDIRNEDTSNITDIQSTQSKVNKSKVNESNIYTVILKTYNDQNIINHKDLTPKIAVAIDKALKKDNKDTVLKAIERYGEAYNDENYQFCTYKMTLEKFLTQSNGYIDWLDEGQKWMNYSDFKNKKQHKTSQHNQEKKIKTKFHLSKSRGDKYSAEELEELILNNQKNRKLQSSSCGVVTNLFDKCSSN